MRTAKMYNKITNPTTSPPLVPPPIFSQQRVYSFSQRSPNTDHISNFLQQFNQCEQMLHINYAIANVLMVNCDDRELLDGMIADQGLNKHIKERMKKYLRLGDYVAIGCPYLPPSSNHNSNPRNRTSSKTYQTKEPKESSAGVVPSVPIQTTHNSKQVETCTSKQKQEVPNPLSTSRYETKQSRFITNKLPLKQTTPRSRSNSSANSNNKFSRIELKSVQKMDKKQSRAEDKSKVGTNERKYKISKREDQKSSKNITNQVAMLKTSHNNTLTVSRLKPSKSTTSPKSQTLSQEKQLHSKHINLSPNNTKMQSSRVHLNIMKNIRQNSKANLNESRKQSYFQPPGNCTNLVRETVHKSLQFFNMIKIMNN